MTLVCSDSYGYTPKTEVAVSDTAIKMMLSLASEGGDAIFLSSTKSYSSSTSSGGLKVEMFPVSFLKFQTWSYSVFFLQQKEKRERALLLPKDCACICTFTLRRDSLGPSSTTSLCIMTMKAITLSLENLAIYLCLGTLTGISLDTPNDLTSGLRTQRWNF